MTTKKRREKDRRALMAMCFDERPRMRWACATSKPFAELLKNNHRLLRAAAERQI